MQGIDPWSGGKAFAAILLLFGFIFLQPKDRYGYCKVLVGVAEPAGSWIMCIHPNSGRPINVYVNRENPPQLGEKISIIEKTELFLFRRYEQNDNI